MQLLCLHISLRKVTNRTCPMALADVWSEDISQKPRRPYPPHRNTAQFICKPEAECAFLTGVIKQTSVLKHNETSLK